MLELTGWIPILYVAFSVLSFLWDVLNLCKDQEEVLQWKKKMRDVSKGWPPST